MDRIIKKKKPDQYPDWLIYSLKGLLLFLLFFNINKQFPDGFLKVADKPDKFHPIYNKTEVEEVSFNHLLSTTQPKIDHYLKWGNKKLPFTDPEINASTEINYQVFSRKEFAEIWTDSFTLQYKGHVLTPNKVNALFIDADNIVATCEDEGDFTNCFYSNLRHYRDDFALWLSIETEEEKTFFTRIKITQKADLSFDINEETKRFWKKLINRDIHKSIDNLTVVKPVFRTADYRFKWGTWERFANGPKGGRRVKLGINTFEKWVNEQPQLYKNGEFVPFSVSINHWNQKDWNHCYINRKTEKSPIISNNECFKDLVQKVKVGHTLSLFLFIKSDFLKTLSPNSLNGLPGFMVNDEYVRFSVPVEIVEDSFDKFNAPLELTTSTFSFQLNSSLGKDAIVRMDTKNPKNESLLKHYSESESAKVVHVDNFKTIRRVITSDDVFIREEDIEKKYILPNKVFKSVTFPEFYDFNIQPPLIKLNGLSTVLDKTTYDLKTFQNTKKGFEFYIGEEKVKLLQVHLTVIPKDGPIIQYVTNNFTRNDIQRRLRKIKSETSLYFDKILFEKDNGEQLLFPLTTALHLK